MKKTVLLITALSFPLAAQAQTQAQPAVPNSAFFAGIGGGYNSTNFGSQDNYSQGVSDVTTAGDTSGTIVATGAAGGSTEFTMDNQSGLAPVLQGGYFKHFADSSLLWGAKFSYSYIDATSSAKNELVPQAGSFARTGEAPVSFTGNVYINKYQTSIKQQIALIPFIGHSFEKNFVYFGAGPTLSQVETKLNSTIGFADISGVHESITGEPTSFSSSEWVYGGAAVVGTTYFIAPSWFVDANFTYGITQNKKNSYSAPFTNTSDGYTTDGTLSGTYSGRVITQALMISINKTF